MVSGIMGTALENYCGAIAAEHRHRLDDHFTIKSLETAAKINNPVIFNVYLPEIGNVKIVGLCVIHNILRDSVIVKDNVQWLDLDDIQVETLCAFFATKVMKIKIRH